MEDKAEQSSEANIESQDLESSTKSVNRKRSLLINRDIF